MRLESHEYTTIDKFFEVCMDEELKAQTRKALDQFKGFHQDDDDYVIITVEGYYAIAEKKYKWANKTNIDELILPYTKNEIYPIQYIKKIITFRKN